MASPATETVDCDILIIGGGMSGCGAAFEAKFWGPKLRVVLVEKAVIEAQWRHGRKGYLQSTATWASATVGTHPKISSST